MFILYNRKNPIKAKFYRIFDVSLPPFCFFAVQLVEKFTLEKLIKIQ